MFEMRSHAAQRAEDEMLQKVLEESRQAAGIQHMNPDEMTYEQLLQLEEENGGRVKVGLSAAEIAKIPQITWRFKSSRLMAALFPALRRRTLSIFLSTSRTSTTSLSSRTLLWSRKP